MSRPELAQHFLLARSSVQAEGRAWLSQGTRGLSHLACTRRGAGASVSRRRPSGMESAGNVCDANVRWVAFSRGPGSVCLMDGMTDL